MRKSCRIMNKGAYAGRGMNILKKIHKFIPGFRQLKSNSMVIAATYYGAAAFIAARYWYWGLALLAAPFFIFSLLDLNASGKGKPSLILAVAAGALILLGSTYGMATGETAPAGTPRVVVSAPADTPSPSALHSATAIPASAAPLPTVTPAPSSASPSPDVVAASPSPTAAATEDLKEYAYVASKNSKVFHRPDCSDAKRIKPGNLMKFRTREDAVASGRRACKKCKP